MNEPWYEQQGPNTEEVRNKLLESYISPNGRYYILEDLGDTTLELWLKTKPNNNDILGFSSKF